MLINSVAARTDDVDIVVNNAGVLDEFHALTDTMARQVGDAYHEFAGKIVEANLMEA